MNNKKGFSLIELIAIIIIIGLILIVAIPAVTQLIKINNNKQYEKYYEIVKAGGLRYSEELKDYLGGHKDTGCKEVTISDLIKENIITEYKDKDITCTGKVRLNNIKGNVSALVNLTCKNKRNVTTYEVKEIEESTCLAYIPIEEEEPEDTQKRPTSLKNRILTDNIAYRDTEESIYAPDGIDFDKVSSDTNGKGLYYTSTNTEDGGTTYYFRGEVTNNYVELGVHQATLYAYRGYSSSYPTQWKDYLTESECLASSYNSGCSKIVINKKGDSIIWRVVRINENGSIRLITEYPIGMSAYIESSTSALYNAYVGYMNGCPSCGTYGATHTNAGNSTVKTLIDNWYKNTLTDLTSMISPTAGFCNDRSLATTNHSTNGTGIGNSSTYYGAYDRVYDMSYYGDPQFACPNKANDLLLYSSSSAIGAKVLTYPIGLLSADEANYAGVPDKGQSSTYYLYSGGQTWTMTPRNTGRIMYTGGHESNTASSTTVMGVRPVINTMDFCVTGNGTKTDPYVYDDDCV